MTAVRSVLTGANDSRSRCNSAGVTRSEAIRAWHVPQAIVSTTASGGVLLIKCTILQPTLDSWQVRMLLNNAVGHPPTSVNWNPHSKHIHYQIRNDQRQQERG